MKTKEYLKEVAYIKECHIENISDIPKAYYSKFDGSYIAFVGSEKGIEHLAEREITEQLTHGVGFSPKDNKWYGWSHRAIYGFGIGSTCKKGECHYKGSTLKEQEEDAIRFWSGDSHESVVSNGVIERGGERYFNISWKYNNEIPNKKLRNTISGVEHHIKNLGRGEWVAKTMEDAKQMAIDFNDGVS